MSKEIYISSTPHETRLAIVESDELTEIYYERENEYTLAGSIYNGRVTRVLPGMQSSFVDIGLERDAFLYITDFMEDEADTAEFDHTGDATPRPARAEGQRSDRGGERNGQRGERNGGGRELGEDRSGGYVSERNQEQARSTPESDMARASEGRGEEPGGRGDRNGRGRGRGRRDRGGNSDRAGGGESSPQREAGSRFLEVPPVAQPAAGGFGDDDAVLPVNVAAPTADAGVEMGEGAPGADGSRRWRGRRGRRRGRGTGTREGGVDSQVAGAESTPDDNADEPVEAPDVQAFQTAVDELPSVPVPATKDEVRTDEPVREERQRGRDGRGERGGRTPAELRVPRGFAPRRSLYGVESEAEAPSEEPIGSIAASGQEPEPLILPGETLSKYRKGGEAAGTTPALSAGGPAAVPDSGFRVDPNWDGGAMLPGETLSRYRGGSAPMGASQPRGETRSETRRPDGRRDGGGQRGDRDQSRDGRGGRREGRQVGSRDRSADIPVREESAQDRVGLRETSAPMVAPAEAPATDLQSGGPASAYGHASERGEALQAARPDFAHSELPEATAEASRIEDGGMAHHAGTSHHGEIERIDAAQQTPAPAIQVEQEYEPGSESISYRVDPAPPREYRMQVAPALAEEEPAHTEAVASSGDAEVALSGEVYQAKSAAEMPGAQPEVQVRKTAWLTALPTGLSALLFGSKVARTTSQADPQGAGQGVTGSHETTTVDAAGAMHSEITGTPAFVAGGAQDFAPGAGDLEEDFIEEEETETTNLSAQGEEEFDELEEEHLEGTADLGTMIRDMTVDHITRANGGVVEEDDDFEEDEVEEGFDDGTEAVEERDGFAAQPGNGFDEEIGEVHRGASSEASGAREEGRPTSSYSERRGRDNAGRGGRERSPGRESGSRYSQGDRNGRRDRTSPGESNGYPSERSGPDRSGLGERARNTGGASDRDRGRSSGRGGRASAQMTNLPAISDLLKPGQEILCQIAKEPIAKKGARITSHIALPGRFLVFMPTVSHTGVSRKIESDGERRRLKEILMSEKGEAAGGFIVRTAAAGASEEELRSDLRFLLNLWSDIKQRSESSKSPALIYHDLNLVERILRDQVTDNFSAIWVDTETEYERVLRFLQRFQPGLIRRVKLYTKETPLFEQFGITEEINKALRSKVWLKSGGSIVINQTEALVAIDINTGKYVGKTARLEDTIVKTNLDAIPEIVRQIRLRDLGGIIIIDFIDMDERKNRNRVMQALEDELKSDRAPSKVLPFNDFGLVAITRKRVRQSLERTLSTTCGVCTGTGMVKSPVTVCNDIYVEMRKMHKHLDRGDVMLRVHPEVVKQLKSTGTRWLQEMEEMCGKTILIKSDPALHPEQFDIH